MSSYSSCSSRSFLLLPSLARLVCPQTRAAFSGSGRQRLAAARVGPEDGEWVRTATLGGICPNSGFGTGCWGGGVGFQQRFPSSSLVDVEGRLHSSASCGLARRNVRKVCPLVRDLLWPPHTETPRPVCAREAIRKLTGRESSSVDALLGNCVIAAGWRAWRCFPGIVE